MRRTCNRVGLQELRDGFIHFQADDLRNYDDVTGAAIVYLAESCPKLQFLSLTSSIFSAIALRAIFIRCLNLEVVDFDSNQDEDNGKLKGLTIDSLHQNPDWAPKLWELINGHATQSRKLKQAIGHFFNARPGFETHCFDNVAEINTFWLNGNERVTEVLIGITNQSSKDE